MSVVEAMVTSISGCMKLYGQDNVCPVGVELPKIAIKLVKLGVARVVVVSRSMAVLDDYWHLLLGSQMSFVPYTEYTTHRCTYMHVAIHQKNTLVK